MVCKLKTQCSVLAACNPKGSYDSDQPITVNIAISSPLLSRFDLVLLLLDSPNEDWDRLASTFLLQGKDLLRKIILFTSTWFRIFFKYRFIGKNDTQKSLWDFEELRLYVNYVKSLEPNLTPDANSVIQK